VVDGPNIKNDAIEATRKEYHSENVIDVAPPLRLPAYWEPEYDYQNDIMNCQVDF
jgi:hypothetical protein